jgi:hypothetical protein
MTNDRKKAEPVTNDERIVMLAIALNRHRSLTDIESRWLEASLRAHDRRTKGTTYWATKDRWTKAEDAKLIRLTIAGTAAHDVAREIGRTAMAVRTRIRQLRRRDKMVLEVKVSG